MENKEDQEQLRLAVDRLAEIMSARKEDGEPPAYTSRGSRAVPFRVPPSSAINRDSFTSSKILSGSLDKILSAVLSNIKISETLQEKLSQFSRVNGETGEPVRLQPPMPTILKSDPARLLPPILNRSESSRPEPIPQQFDPINKENNTILSKIEKLLNAQAEQSVKSPSLRNYDSGNMRSDANQIEIEII